jgi:hypothetical protein
VPHFHGKNKKMGVVWVSGGGDGLLDGGEVGIFRSLFKR